MADRYRKSTEIIELANAFENCLLPPEKWTHEVYLTIIFWHLFFNPAEEARTSIQNSFRRYCFEHNIAPTAAAGYNETLMVFWITMIGFYMRRFEKNYSFLELANAIVREFGTGNCRSDSTAAKDFFPLAQKSNGLSRI